jgi:hypothetical protein
MENKTMHRKLEREIAVADSKLIMKFTEALKNYSPQMTAVAGAILGHDFGLRDRRGNRWVGLSITSDGFVIASTEPVSSGAMIGTADELAHNLALLICDANLTPEETKEYGRRYDAHVTNWRVS